MCQNPNCKKNLPSELAARWKDGETVKCPSCQWTHCGNKVFISSTSKMIDFIKPTLLNMLRSLGYDPIYFREKWEPGRENPIKSSFENLHNSDRFILILGNKAGSMILNEITQELTFITEEEYIGAHEIHLKKDMDILVFIESEVFNSYNRTYIPLLKKHDNKMDKQFQTELDQMYDDGFFPADREIYEFIYRNNIMNETWCILFPAHNHQVIFDEIKNKWSTFTVQSSNKDLDKEDLKKELKLIRTSIECPTCGAPTGDLFDTPKFTCDFCGDTFVVDNLDPNTKKNLSYNKILELSKIQTANTTMSSRMDIQYDPSLYVERHDANTKFQAFLDEENKNRTSFERKLFLLHGEAGFGKTWLVAHWAKNLIAEGYPVFYIRFNDGIESFFNTLSGKSATEELYRIQLTMNSIDREIENYKPIVWICDGYDENTNQQRRSELFSNFLVYIQESSNQLVVLTSRVYDWEVCTVRRGQNNLIKNLCWLKVGDIMRSHLLDRLTDTERDAALREYDLPEISEWPKILKVFSYLPLWIRFLSELKTEGEFPNTINSVLLAKYFKRMDIKPRELTLLSEISALLVTDVKDLKGNLNAIRIPLLDTNSLKRLYTGGIIRYVQTGFYEEVNLVLEVFGWFGITYYANNLKIGNKSDELTDFLGTIKKSNISGKPYIENFLKEDQFRIKASITKTKKKIEEYEKAFDDLIERVNTYQQNFDWDNAVRLLSQAIDLSKELSWEVDEKTARELLKKVKEQRKIKDKQISENRKILEEAEIKIEEHNWDEAMKKFSESIMFCERHELVEEKKYVEDIISQTEKFHFNMKLGASRSKEGNFSDAIKNYSLAVEICQKQGWKTDLKLAEMELKKAKLEKAQKTKIDFKGTILTQLEVEFLKEVENLTKKDLSLLHKMQPDTKIGFTTKNEHLTGLWLIKCGIKAIPKSIQHLKYLKILVLSNNRLDKIPNFIGKLKSLQHLDLDSNNLTYLPESLGKLRFLKVLSCMGNNITEIPKNIDELKSLEYLNCSKNQIVSLPETFGALTSLKELYLFSNNIESLPKSFGNLKSLEYLNLYCNKLVVLPPMLKNLENLKELDLSKNNFIYIPKEITKLTYLEKLSLRENDISKIPSGFSNLQSLKFLDLRANHIKNLPHTLCTISSLKELNLRENEINFISNKIINLSLTVLDLKKNPIYSDRENKEGMKALLKQISINGTKVFK